MPKDLIRDNVVNETFSRVIGALSGRQGFDAWWKNIAPDVQGEIEKELKNNFYQTLSDYEHRLMSDQIGEGSINHDLV